MMLGRIEVTSAVPLDDRRGRRSIGLLAALGQRDRLLIEAAARFYPGCSQRETARLIHIALSRFRDGRWRRDRIEALCPVQHRGKLTATLWRLLKVRDHVPSEMTIRRALFVNRQT